MLVSFVAIRFDYSDYDLASACAIGLVKVKDGKTVDEFYRPFMPHGEGFSFVEDAGQTGGLRLADIQFLDGFETIWPEIVSFLEDLPLVGNSASTYMKTLEILWDEAEIAVGPRPFLCTQVLGRRLTDLGSFNLEYYAHSFGFVMADTPTALDKSRATAAIVLGLVDEVDADSLDSLAEEAGVKWGSLSSEERTPCKVERHEDRMSVAERQAMREKYEKDGFDEAHPLFGKHVVVTGTLRRGTGTEVDEMISKVGGFADENFTKKTNYLVVGYDRIGGLTPGGKTTGKIDKSIEARAKGQIVEVVDEQTFMDLLDS